MSQANGSEPAVKETIEIPVKLVEASLVLVNRLVSAFEQIADTFSDSEKHHQKHQQELEKIGSNIASTLSQLLAEKE